MFWLWMNIPLMLVFFCLWTGIPLWYTHARWRAELNAKHAELAAGLVPAPALTAEYEARSLAYAGAGGPAGR